MRARNLTGTVAENENGGCRARVSNKTEQCVETQARCDPKREACSEVAELLRSVGPNVRHERRAKGREAAFGTSARWRG